MMNFKKFLSAGSSRISMMTLVAAGLLGLGGGIAPVPAGIFHAPPEPLPRHKRGHCKRGGKQKRCRNLNYWRR